MWYCLCREDVRVTLRNQNDVQLCRQHKRHHFLDGILVPLSELVVWHADI